MNIGILVEKTDNNQEAFMAISQANNINYDNPLTHICIFSKELSPMCSKFIGTIAPIEKAFHSDCHLIATNIELAHFALNAYNTKRKILYISEIEWLFNKKDYLYNCSILLNDKLDIIVPSIEYDKELFNYCGKRSYKIIPNFNLERIINEVCTIECEASD